MTEKCILSFHSRKSGVWKKIEKRMKVFNICGSHLAVAAVDGRSQLIRNRASQYFEVSLLAQSVVGESVGPECDQSIRDHTLALAD